MADHTPKQNWSRPFPRLVCAEFEFLLLKFKNFKNPNKKLSRGEICVATFIPPVNGASFILIYLDR